MIHPLLQEAMRRQVYPITRRIAIGQFATPERAEYLRQQGITHILNVGEGASIVACGPTGFRQAADHPIVDLARIPDAVALTCLNALHQMLAEPDSRVYLHCIACQNRSPTILWLYLIACGLEADAAKELISHRCPDAVPGHGALIDDRLVQCVREHGSNRFLPLSDPGILEPAY